MSIAPALLVVMFVGAANADATPEQRERLRTTVSFLRDRSLTASEAYVKAVKHTAEVMGPDWRPKGEWDETITNILGWSE